MDDHDDEAPEEESPPRRPPRFGTFGEYEPPARAGNPREASRGEERVRLIRDDEEAELSQREDVVHRRSPNQPRFGDRPGPVAGPAAGAERPALRFPLSHDADPNTVDRRSIAGNTTPGNPQSSVFADPDRGNDLVDQLGLDDDPPNAGNQGSGYDAPGSDEPRYRGQDDPYGDSPTSVTPIGEASSTRGDRRDGQERRMPHWTEPATGEVPRIFEPEPEMGGADPGAEVEDEDLATWSAFATQSPRWRDQPGDWDDANVDDLTHLADHDARAGLEGVAAAGAAPQRHTFDDEPAHSEDFGHQLEDGAGRNLSLALATGLALFAAAAFLLTTGPGATMFLVTPVIVIAAAEYFTAVRQVGYQPATLLGLVATAGLVLGTFWQGEAAMPMILFLAVTAGLGWNVLGLGGDRPTSNLAVTMLGVLWVGFLGSFASLILTRPEGTGYLFGVIFATVASDTGAYFVGRSAGRSPMAPAVSPNKTFEGLVGGMVAAILASIIVLQVAGVGPWDGEIGSIIALGLVVSLAAPIGDLCQSMVKRDLGIKDMGTILPGHGGVLDRFDAMLFALPAAYYLIPLLNHLI